MSEGGFASLSHFCKIDGIPYFDIRYSLFDILFSRVSFPIRLAVFLASGGAEPGTDHFKIDFGGEFF